MVIYVIPLYGVSWCLNLNMSSVGGRFLKLTDYFTEHMQVAIPFRPSQDRGRNYEAEPRPRQYKVETKALQD